MGKAMMKYEIADYLAQKVKIKKKTAVKILESWRTYRCNRLTVPDIAQQL